MFVGFNLQSAYASYFRLLTPLTPLTIKLSHPMCLYIFASDSPCWNRIFIHSQCTHLLLYCANIASYVLIFVYHTCKLFDRAYLISLNILSIYI